MSQKSKNIKNGINIIGARESHKHQMFQDMMIKVLILNDGKIEFKNKD